MSNSNSSSKLLLEVLEEEKDHRHNNEMNTPSSSSPRQQTPIADAPHTKNTPTPPSGNDLSTPTDPESPLPPTRHRKRESRVAKFISLFRGQGPLTPFKLLKSDLKGRSKLWHTDWYFNQLVLASAVYLFFTNLLPGITFASDLYVLTGRNYGTIEVVFSTGLCGVIFALFSAQPLTILGVTGPFCILSERIYHLCHNNFHIEYLPFMAWSCIHSAWMHWLLAIFNAHDWTMEYVTTFSTEIFSLLNSVIYFHKAVQELERAHANTSLASFLYSVIGCIGTFLVAVTLSTADSWPVFHRYVRMGLSEYAAAISIIVFIGMPQIGELKDLDQQRLPVSTSFRPTLPTRTHFFVHFWDLEPTWILAAILPGLIITTLFFFDVEVSTICATLPRYNIRKPGGFAWDVFLLGITTALCGILGIPPANGLLPQAPLHSESLLHDEEEVGVDGDVKRVKTVHEQRWSHLLHAVGISVFVCPPFMKVLGLTPTSVLAGLFLFMGEQSLSVNPILFRFLNLLTPTSSLPPLPNQKPQTYKQIHLYTLLQIILTAGIFAITFTPAAPAFPVIIVLLVPVRLKLMSKWWDHATLKLVDSWACKKEGDIDDDASPRGGLDLDGRGDTTTTTTTTTTTITDPIITINRNEEEKKTNPNPNGNKSPPRRRQSS